MEIKNPRAMALEVLYAIERDEAYSNIALNKVLEKYRPEKLDRSFVTELVYGTLRSVNTIDWILAGFLKKPLRKLNPWIRNILRMGVYQIKYMDKVPDSAACNESVNLVKALGQAGMAKMVNGVLRNVVRNINEIEMPEISKDPVKAISILYSHPEWLVRRWIKDYGVKGTEEFCKANNIIPPNSIRTNTLKIGRDGLRRLLADEGIEAIPGKFAPETLIIDGFKSVGSIAAHKSGLFMVQDESSTLVGHAVSPRQGAVVIDACSAPGGKSTHMAQLMKNEGKIISADVHPHKIELIKENADRLGITIIEPVVLDATELHKIYPDTADFVLVDAPCSGLGVLRRRPEIRWRKKEEQIKELQALQHKIIKSAARCVKPDGVLVYSTCTVTREENNEVIEKFLNKNPEFYLDDLTGFLPDSLKGIPGTDTLTKGFMQFLPHLHGTDGFFIARMRRKGKIKVGGSI